MYFAHGPLSYILNEKIQKEDISKLNRGEHIAIALLSFFFGVLPDFDFFLLSMTNTPPFQHHQVITHSLLFWLLIWLLFRICIYIFKKIINSKTKSSLSDTFLDILQKTFLIGVISHLFADILFSHSQIFFPLTWEVTILGNIFEKNYFNGNLYTISMALEFSILLFFVLDIYKKFLKKQKIFEYTIYTCIFFSFCLILFSSYISLNTYNNAKYFVNGVIVYDEDFDSLIDYNDPDTDNDGKDNIQSIDKDILTKDIQNILTEKYLTSNRENILNRIIYKYGGLTSYRLISQGFFNQNSPVEPVLNSFARKEYNIREYGIEHMYDELLYTYFKQNNLLKDFNVNVERGNIFFVLDNTEKVVNMGIVLDDNMVGIVLKRDVRAKIHSLQEIFDTYPEYIFKVQKED